MTDYTQKQSFLERNETSERLLKEKLANKEEEYNVMIEKGIKTDKELRVLVQQLPTQARAKFVEKIKKDPKRNVVEEIATVETLFDLLDGEVMNGLTVDEKKAEGYMKELYPDPILDHNTRISIIQKQKEIRGKLKQSY